MDAILRDLTKCREEVYLAFEGLFTLCYPSREAIVQIPLKR